MACIPKMWLSQVEKATRRAAEVSQSIVLSFFFDEVIPPVSSLVIDYVVARSGIDSVRKFAKTIRTTSASAREVKIRNRFLKKHKHCVLQTPLFYT